MAWHAGTATGAHDLVAKVVQMATSKHVSAVAINAAGTGYTVGDTLTVPHSGGLLSATAEVLTVGGSGEVTSVKLRNMGAYSNRVATATMVAGGTNYVVGDILEVAGGTSTEKARLRVATLSGSAVATVTVYEGGGAYSVAPSGTLTTTLVGPSTGTGTGATFTVTMTSLVGTSGVATTGGTGSGCTLNLTLTDTGWSAERNRNNYSFNSVNNEKEIVLKGTAGGGDHPYIGFRTYTATVGPDTRYGVLIIGMTAHNSATAMSLQQDVSTSTPADNLPLVPLFNTSMPFWFSFNGRKMYAQIRTDGGAIDSYQNMYAGLLNPMGTQVESPYPLVLCGSSSKLNEKPDSAADTNTGLCEARGSTSNACPMYMFEISDRSYQQLFNVNAGTALGATRGVWPLFQGANTTSTVDIISDVGPLLWDTTVWLATGGVATRLIYPTSDPGDDPALLFPLTVLSTANGATQGALTFIHGEFDGLFWISGTKSDGSRIDPQDTITIGSDRYRIFPCAHRRERYSFYCVKES